MNTIKITILFYIQKNRINKRGHCPIRCRITFNFKRKEFATGLFINPNYWNSKQQKANPPNDETNFINTQLSLIRSKINQAFLLLQVSEPNFDVEDIFLSYKGESIKKEQTFLEVLELHNNRMEKLVGKEYAPRYYQKWQGTNTILKGFIKDNFKKNDILLNKITIKFLEDLDFYLKSKKNQKQITVNKCIQRVRTIMKLALAEGYLAKDPFVLYRPKRVVHNIVFLNEDELNALKKHAFSQVRLEQVRDMFVFCCYTGLAYNEMSNLKSHNIVKGFDGQLWIEMYREKTKKHFSVPLLLQAQDILAKYEVLLEDKRLLPKISNQKFNSYLKEIADIVGINKKLTHHTARKTFASTVLLYNDVPIEVVSELLGHSKISVTQEYYAKVVNKKLGEQMAKINKKLKP